MVIRGWLYLIKNGDLYKIGITRNFEKRMLQLKPDKLIAKLYSRNFRELERELHNKYKSVRIPQTEYFRLDHSQVGEIKKRISRSSLSNLTILFAFAKSLLFLLLIYSIIILLFSLTINDMNVVVFRSLLWMERISFGFSLVSFFYQSDLYLGIINELKFRLSRSCIFLLCAFFFKGASRFIY
tara:strand:+ start:111 stop:659 length:549 start_codon:yes stop_codon:yes gene_type:complete